MFDSIVQEKPRRGWVSVLLAASLGAHGIALLVVLFIDQLRVGPVPEPAIAITFVDLASAPPPPPPPPPPKKRSTPKKVEVKQEQVQQQAPKEFVAPKDIPTQQEEKKEEAPPEDTGSDDGVEGGVEGGVAGGVVAGATTAPPPPPPPPPPPTAPPPPTFQEVEFVKKRRIEGHEPVYPQAALRAEEEGVLVAKIVIGPEGRVTEITFTQTHPAFERSVRDTIAGWRFTPHVVDGRPVAVYTIVKFTFRLEDAE